jgi:S1-C subfamily serine protease
MGTVASKQRARVIVMILALVAGGQGAWAQRTGEEEKRFRERQSRRAAADIVLEVCMQKEILRDVSMQHVSVEAAVSTAIDACSSALEKYALAHCAASYKEGVPSCAERNMLTSFIRVRREQEMATWVPVLLKRRVELPSDGPRHLFEFAAPFVYAVIAKNEKDGTSAEGSAVAVGDHLLATGCHLVEKATGKTEIDARRLLPGSASKDRCLLGADEKLAGFAAIREWESLNVGERIFAIGVAQGSPTLSDGLVSGKRTNGINRLVQTTAPVSEASSGWGLFDSSGRLVGITTLATTSKQSLNFAIAAEDWRYDVCFASRGPDRCEHYLRNR